MFISVEGLDFSGKTTVVDAIADEHDSTVVTEEPSDLTFGRQVRDRLSQEDSNPIIDFFLFMVDRQQHINERIQPAMREGKLVVSDRYADSTRAYQPVALTGDSIEKPFDSTWEAKYFIEQCMDPWNLTPDLTLYLDISVDTAIERMSTTSQTDVEKYENRRFLTQVRENYEALCDTHDRIIRIDAEQDKDDVVWDALAQMNLIHQSDEYSYNYNYNYKLKQ